jgi:hypothetical protein
LSASHRSIRRQKWAKSGKALSTNEQPTVHIHSRPCACGQREWQAGRQRKQPHVHVSVAHSGCWRPARFTSGPRACSNNSPSTGQLISSFPLSFGLGGTGGRREKWEGIHSSRSHYGLTLTVDGCIRSRRGQRPASQSSVVLVELFQGEACIGRSATASRRSVMASNTLCSRAHNICELMAKWLEGA